MLPSAVAYLPPNAMQTAVTIYSLYQVTAAEHTFPVTFREIVTKIELKNYWQSCAERLPKILDLLFI
jgi:hypothetical protein